MGNTRGTTPNLDRFAAEGRVFEQAHAHNVITFALAHEHPDGTAPVPAWRAGERGVQALPEVRNRGLAAQGPGLRDGRLRRGLRARLALRPRPRLRRLRGAVPASRRATRVQHPAGSGRGRGHGGAGLVSVAGRQAPLPVDPRLRSACPVRPARGLRRAIQGRPVSRRGRVHGLGAGAPARGGAHGGSPAAARRHRRPRRGAGRPRRADPRSSLLRGDPACPALRVVPSASAGGPGRNARAPHRHPADDPRHGRRNGARRPARPISPARPAQGGRGRNVLRGALGRVQSRVGAVARVDGRRTEVHRAPAARALRSAEGPGRRSRTWWLPGRTRSAVCASG